jgi:hypothetical protein
MSDDAKVSVPEGAVAAAKDAAWEAYCYAPTSRDLGRSKVFAAADAVIRSIAPHILAANAPPVADGVRVPDGLIETLRAQAKEIASAGHAGWGNTMTTAADALAASPQPPAIATHGADEGVVRDAMRYRFMKSGVSDVAQAIYYTDSDQWDRIVDDAMSEESPPCA